MQKEKSHLEINSLLESNPYLRQILSSIEQVIWIYDLNSGQIIYVCPAFETVWGRPCESLLQDPSILIQSVHPEDRVIVMSASPGDDHKASDLTYRIIRPDGNLRWISSHSFLIHGVDENTSYQVCIAQDVTAQNQVDQALRKALDQSREQFTLSRRMSLARKPEAVLKSLMSAQELRSAQRASLFFFDDPDLGPSHGVEQLASWVFSQDKTVWTTEAGLYEEPSFWDLAQANRTIIINNISTNPRLPSLLRDLLLEAKINTFVLFPLITSGEWLGCLVVYYEKEIRFSHIELRHLKVLIKQATITLYNLELLKDEEESRHEAEHANEIKTEFLGMISHELRTPLTSIIGFTTTLLADDVTWQPYEQHDFIQTIQQEAFRLQELIDHLLDLSRLEAGMLPIHQKPYSLQEIIDEASSQLQTLAHGRELSLQLPPNLPQVFADKRRIAQVLVNLVRNASNYAPMGTEINISALTRNDFIQVNVKDFGPGIPIKEHKKVFKAFTQGNNVENGITKGAGLGLAICKGLVEAHGGRIWIKKNHPPGATLCFTIPIVRNQILSGIKREE